MKWLVLVLIGAAVAAILLWWYASTPTAPSPYPLIDPAHFFDVLPNMPKRDTVGTAPQHFDQYGYMEGERGARISAGHIWTKRPYSEDNPYDVDLMMRVILAPSEAEASRGYLAETKQDQETFGSKAETVEFPFPLRAAEATFVRLTAKRPRYFLNARYGNYLFKLSATIANGGHFENEADITKLLKTLDEHIDVVLQESIAPKASAR